MKMMQMTGDPSLYIKKIGGRTIGMLGSYVDFRLFAGDRKFYRFIEYTRINFESKSVEWDNIEFLWVQILTKQKDGDTWLEINQCEYIDKIQQITSSADFTTYRSERAKVSWICHTRPDICCIVNRASQVMEEKLQKRCIQSLNKLIRRIKQSTKMVLKYHKLDQNRLHIRVYSDASSAPNEDKSSR